MLADEVRDWSWVIEGDLVAATVDGGVDEEFDGVFQRCVDESFALVFLGSLVGTPWVGGLLAVDYCVHFGMAFLGMLWCGIPGH